MTVALEDDIWTDPSDGYTIRVARFPYSVDTEDGEHLMGFSFHTGALWCEIPGQDNHGKRPKEIQIGPLVKTHTQFFAALLERGFGPDTHYLLGRRRVALSRARVRHLLRRLVTEMRPPGSQSGSARRVESVLHSLQFREIGRKKNPVSRKKGIGNGDRRYHPPRTSSRYSSVQSPRPSIA